MKESYILEERCLGSKLGATESYESFAVDFNGTKIWLDYLEGKWLPIISALADPAHTVA